ncbi:MAG: class I SAM-dependent methyltransferase [Bacteroidales bacterium]|nr:class I SAM-dependent methyltransferase [Bacteroidales bacterium]
MIKFLHRHIPRPVLIRFSGIFSMVVRPFYAGNHVECPVCKKHFRKFLPYGSRGLSNRLCPKCLSLERHRLIWLYLQNFTRFFEDNLKMLHIAPEQPFIKRFKKCANLDYQTADLCSPIADLHFDIMHIPLADNSYDIVMSNHVLEHVENDIVAMKEIYRVLKPGGWAILQVPIDPDRQTTYEDKNIVMPSEREKAFGQYDHLRIHGLDYPTRLAAAGFDVQTFDPKQHFPANDIPRYRLDPDEILFVAKK